MPGPSGTSATPTNNPPARHDRGRPPAIHPRAPSPTNRSRTTEWQYRRASPHNVAVRISMPGALDVRDEDGSGIGVGGPACGRCRSCRPSNRGGWSPPSSSSTASGRTPHRPAPPTRRRPRRRHRPTCGPDHSRPDAARVEAAARAALGHDGYEEYVHEQYAYGVDTSGPAAVRELARLTLGGCVPPGSAAGRRADRAGRAHAGRTRPSGSTARRSARPRCAAGRGSLPDNGGP